MTSAFSIFLKFSVTEFRQFAEKKRNNNADDFLCHLAEKMLCVLEKQRKKAFKSPTAPIGMTTD